VFQRIASYDIVREIGRGGMATVFLANDTRTGGRVALKLVPVGTDRDSREVLQAEQWGARLHEQFSKVCPQVPALYEYQTEGQYFYIAMELIEGHNLSEVIARGAVQPDRAVALAIELSRVLETAHNFETTIDGRHLRSLIHGDLNPRNVRLTPHDELKVLDFGIAKALSLSRRVTRNDFGSMAYLSPERLETDGHVDAHADCWAVGVLLYEMLSGEQPFRASDTRQLEKRITSRQPPVPLTERCPEALQAIVGKLLAPRQSDRYESAKTIREDLERFARGEKTEAERVGWRLRVVDAAATRRTHPAADEPATQRTHKAAVIPPPLPPVTPPPLPTAAPPAPAARSRRLRIPRLRSALAIIVLLMILNELSVVSQAVRARTAVPSRELDGLEEIWKKYDALSERSFFRLGTLPLERSLERQTRLLTDRVIDRYKSGSDVVWEPEWTQARQALMRASAVAGSDSYLRASLRYSDGHLFRINGEARKARREIDDAQAHFSQAVTAFREAAALRPDWPDPFLGLARTFIYGLEDVDRGADALKQAQRRGYKPGERETLQLAHGYWRRAESLARTARKLTDLPQEQEYLSRAAEDYQQALSLYDAAVGSDVADRIRVAQRGLARVAERLHELTSAGSLEVTSLPGVPVPETPQWP
jgi:hypothetical protein